MGVHLTSLLFLVLLLDLAKHLPKLTIRLLAHEKFNVFLSRNIDEISEVTRAVDLIPNRESPTCSL